MEKKLTRAEQRALEKYPVNMTPLNYQDLIEQFGGKTEIDVNTYPRRLFQQGYEQAEKDLELTWKDIRKIPRILDMIVDDDIKGKIPEEWGDEEYYEEVLRRFYKAKEETK